MALLILKTFLLKRGNIAYDGYRKVKGVKLSVLVDLQVYLYIIVPANKNDSTLYIPTLKNFKIKKPVGRPVNRSSEVTADAIYKQLKSENTIG
ncbi:MAG: transposase [Methanosarcina sp.]